MMKERSKKEQQAKEAEEDSQRISKIQEHVQLKIQQ